MEIPKMMMSAGFGGRTVSEEKEFMDIEAKLKENGYEAEEEIVYGDDSEGFTYVKHSKQWLDSDDEEYIHDGGEWVCEIRMPQNTVIFRGPDGNEKKYTFDETRKESWSPPS